MHNGFALKFFFCEFLNLVNVAGQLILMDFFFNGEFRTVGFRVFEVILT